MAIASKSASDTARPNVFTEFGRRPAGTVAGFGIGRAIGGKRIGDGAEAHRPLERDRQLAGLHQAFKAKSRTKDRRDIHGPGGKPCTGGAVPEGDGGLGIVVLARHIEVLAAAPGEEARRFLPQFAIDPDFERRCAFEAAGRLKIGEVRARELERLKCLRPFAMTECLERSESRRGSPQRYCQEGPRRRMALREQA